jgi:hypothetical protein
MFSREHQDSGADVGLFISPNTYLPLHTVLLGPDVGASETATDYVTGEQIYLIAFTAMSHWGQVPLGLLLPKRLHLSNQPAGSRREELDYGDWRADSG